MSPEDRRELARALAAIDLPHPRLEPKQVRRRQLGMLTMLAICVFLAAWIVLLMRTLPSQYTSSHWRGVWVGLDMAELAGFAATAWAAWHQRQIIIFCMVFTGTLLLSDAWFDLMLDAGAPAGADHRRYGHAAGGLRRAGAAAVAGAAVRGRADRDHPRPAAWRRR